MEPINIEELERNTLFTFCETPSQSAFTWDLFLFLGIDKEGLVDALNLTKHTRVVFTQSTTVYIALNIDLYSKEDEVCVARIFDGQLYRTPNAPKMPQDRAAVQIDPYVLLLSGFSIYATLDQGNLTEICKLPRVRWLEENCIHPWVELVPHVY